MTKLFESTDYIILIGSIFIILIIIVIIATNNPRIFERTVENASKETEFKSTYFEIYDKSKDGVCDRLIIVQPFMWYIWAKNGTVYLLNETNEQCAINYTPAAIVPSSKLEDYYTFQSVCINNVLNDIITSYTDKIIPVKIYYEIAIIQSESNKFTILDALNELFKNWITMDTVSSKMNIASKIIKPQELFKTYSVSTINAEDKYKLEKVLASHKRLKKVVHHVDAS